MRYIRSVSRSCAWISSRADVLVQSISDFSRDETWWDSYSLVLLVGPSSLSSRICTGAAEQSIPLFYIHSVGFYSHFSLQLPERFPVVDTHPDPASTQDLRLLSPWPELQSLQKSMTKHLATLDDQLHGHVPYTILLLYFLESWKATHDGKPPQDYKEKKEFKSLVESNARTSNPEGGEENFQEASAAVLKSLNPPSISSGLRQIFEDSACDYQHPGLGSFWPIAAGIRDFHKAHDGLLPLPGSIPDMKAQSADYIRLQNVYKQKARDDLAEVTAIIKQTRSSSLPPVSDTETEAFCKNAAHVKLIRGSPIHIWNSTASSIPPQFFDAQEKKHLRQLFLDPTSLFPIYLAFQIYDYFSTAIADKTDPPTIEEKIQFAHTRIDELFGKTTTATTTENSGTENDGESEVREQIDSILREFDRADGAELHNIAALTGGMVAQEVIKVVTKQYVPVDNVCVFDGIGSKTAVFKI